uniref:SWIM-type domain-containing protein n=1 Tax=Lactuca sativa TaxID=4236 RepID=A0A9R1X624_LACSA|nr:hypothetical protein LSAT_V11C600320910 [Lactuca sativa]
MITLYYCEPGKPLISGITAIANDEDYGSFIFQAYGTYGKICMYVDHDGQGIEDWFGSKIEEEDGDYSCIDGGENKDEIDNLTDVDVDFNEEVVTMNRTKGDEFLNRLFGEEEEGNDNNIHDHDGHEEDANIPILGMRFKDPAQLKSMLCNYAVANGYQICFEKNDRKRLLVKCYKGEFSFRLWASWMSDESSFQIKSLKLVHKCARNYKLGSMVTYSWIGSHYTIEFLLRQKMSVRKVRTIVSQKFGIHVSVGQCRRAKKYALQLITGTLVEHYAKLWSYAEEIWRSNPGSTVKLDVNHMPDGKNYFSKFYVCFNALKKGWKERCRNIIGLDGWFLKGICKGELLYAVGSDANNGICPSDTDEEALNHAMENGMSKSFNVVIVDARKKPIITMLEELRMYMMERTLQVLPSGLNQFIVRGTTNAYEVDLEERTCSCRLLQLNEIGCVHSIATISFMNREVETYVDKMFSIITYMKAYKFRTMPGRPATKGKGMQQKPQTSQVKNQRQLPKHKTKVKVSKAGKKQKCSLCKIEGHNKRACTLTRPPKTEANRKKGVAEALSKDDEGNQSNAVNDGVVKQEDYDEVELSPLEFDASSNGEPIHVHVQEQEARETPVATLLKIIKRKKSERIIKLKLGKKVGGADAPGNSEAKHLHAWQGLVLLNCMVREYICLYR